MRILIQNYSDTMTTQPMYLHQCFRATEAAQSHLWNVKDPISAFDMLDRFNPDVFITSYKTINKDIIKYLGQRKIPTVCDITNAAQEVLDQLDNMIAPLFYITENYNFLSDVKSRNVINRLHPALDVFSIPRSLPDFTVPVALICANANDDYKSYCEEYDSYHKINLAGQEEGFDLTENLATLSSLYQHYDKVILCDDIKVITSQVFFDSLMKSKNMFSKVPESQKELFNEFLSNMFEEEETDDLLDGLKKQIAKKHTCFSRASRLMELLNNQEAAKKLTEAIR